MVDSSSSIKLENTLEDGAWKDSFDKILEPRSVTRELKVPKRNVRASFNIDSSVENSRQSDLDVSGLLAPPATCLLVNEQKGHDERRSTISTPVAAGRLALDPFKCSLSPIGAWKLRFFNKADKATTKRTISVEGPLHATPINPDIMVVEYNESQKDNSSLLIGAAPKVFSPLPMPPRCSTLKEGKRTRSQRHVCFQSVMDQSPFQKKKSSAPAEKRSGVVHVEQHEEGVFGLTLQPGKWRKSLNMWRRNQQQEINERRTSVVNGTFDNSVEFVANLGTIAGRRISIFLKPERFSESFAAVSPSRQDDWQYRVLKRCQQEAPMPFDAMYGAEMLKNCKKIGEGAYGEVFLNAATKRKFGEGATVLKIIPIEGKEKVNGEIQKTFEQILTEVVISIELSSLRDLAGASGSTSGFVGVKKVACVRGKYPKHLIKLWEEYDERKGSENDHPVVFSDTQLYMVLELEFGGQDLEAFQFVNAEQTYYALQQIVFTLAVAEEVFQFEHRDLHWGNVLILNTSLKQLKYTLNNKQLILPTKGVKITIIDYTLSRMTFDDYCFYNDLSCDDELFAATGDYQFDIYRMMRELLKNNWESFEARTNIFWISYIISKLIDGVSYKNTRTKTHSMHMKKLQHLKDIILDFESATEFAQHLLEMT